MLKYFTDRADSENPNDTVIQGQHILFSHDSYPQNWNAGQ